MPRPQHLTVIKGTTHTFLVTITNNDAEVDLTSYKVYFRVKDSTADSTNVIAKSSDNSAEVEILDQVASTGQCYVKLLASDTYSIDEGRYVYDVWAVDLTTGNRHDVIGPFNFDVESPVTVLSPP